MPAIYAEKSKQKAVFTNESLGKIYRAALEQEPRNAQYLQLMGELAREAGQYDEAMKWHRQALKICPDQPEALASLAELLIQKQEFCKAIPLLKRAHHFSPDNASVLFNLGLARQETGRIKTAREAYKKALALKPDFPEALNNLGNLLTNEGKLTEAAELYQQAIASDPQNAAFHNNLGLVWIKLGKFKRAAQCELKALALEPNCPEAYSNLGALADCAGRFNEAIDYCLKALQLRPDYPEALENLGNALLDAGHTGRAITTYRKAAKLNPGDMEIRHNLSMALLTAGAFEEGLKLYEDRWETRQMAHARRALPQPQWQGEPAAGKTLFIHFEQGLGDTIQFCRYAPMAAERGMRVLLEAQPPLTRLLSGLPGVETLTAEQAAHAKFDLHCPMLSLPRAFETRWETIPWNGPYLRAERDRVAAWHEKLRALGNGKPRVGLAWAGKARRAPIEAVMLDRRRSMSPAMLPALTKQSGIQFFSLQKEGPKAPPEMGIIDLMNDCVDFAETAALMENLDLIISVDTAVAHLAGAMGKPVWMMNRFDSCWRWGRNRQSTPWHPSMRIFNQPAPGDWESVIERIAAELAGSKFNGFGE